MGTIKYDYLRPKKAEHLKEWYDADFAKKQQLDLWRGKDAVILPLRKFNEDNLQFGRGGVIDSEGNYIELSKIDNRIDMSYECKDVQYKNEKVVYLGYLINHWGHFLVEAVSRLWYFLESDATVDKYVFFIENGSTREIKGNYREFLELLGIWDKIEIINVPTRYREVIVPELGYKWRTHYSQKMLDVFEVIAQNVDCTSFGNLPDKIFLSRSALSKGKGLEFGLESIDDFYIKNGYEVVFPETISLSRMIAYIRNAKICASFSGSLPHNMLFANNGQKVVILERLVLNNEIQVDVNKMKNLDVIYIDSNIPLYTVNMSGPFIVLFNDIMQRYAEDNNMVFPEKKYFENKFLGKCFKLYMKAYEKEYGYQWYMLDWYTDYTDYLLEAYRDGYNYYSEFLSRQKPFTLRHYFKFHYLKQFVKRIINR